MAELTPAGSLSAGLMMLQARLRAAAQAAPERLGTPVELSAFKPLGAEMLRYDDTALAKAVASGALEEVGADE